MWSKSRKYFAIYAETCFSSFGDRVKNWITINEPLHTAVNGYCTGSNAPGRRENPSTEPYLVAHHQLLAHAEAVSIYNKKYKVYLFSESKKKKSFAQGTLSMSVINICD